MRSTHNQLYMEEKAWRILRRIAKAEERRTKKRYGMGRVVQKWIYDYDERLKEMK